MSFIYSYGTVFQPIATVGSHKCSICEKVNEFYVVKAKKSLRFILIPLLNWNEKLWLMCGKCNGYRDLSIDEFNKVLKLPYTYVNKDLILRKEWYEYKTVWLLLIIISIASFLLYVLLFFPTK